MNNREFALEVARMLSDAGFVAYWAGGCVRDALLNIEPKDYDVATDARPEQVQQIFGKRRSRLVGAAFGVTLVNGPRGVSPVEVATFREDGVYSDGRRPDEVSYSTPQRDAQRRDFTMNGMFFDPLQDRIIDYVNGQRDLNDQVVRAIGDPLKRIAEDKLRMIRGVRFAARFDFELESATFAAIQNQAATLQAVSAERITGELQRMLTHHARVRAVELLKRTGLLAVILPESVATIESDSHWETQQTLLSLVQPESFCSAVAALLRNVYLQHQNAIRKICKRLRFSNDSIDRIEAMLADEQTLRSAHTLPWPAVQRILAKANCEERLQFAEAVCQAHKCETTGVEFCRRQLSLGESVWNPPPLISGDDLIASGLKPGRRIRDILEATRNAQLVGDIASKDEALQFAKRLAAAG